MKKGDYIILFLFGILFLPTISSYLVTGAATSQETGVSVFVLPAAPLIRIDSPTDGSSYNEGNYILLDYTAILIDTVWYNLDNGVNITINSSSYFTASVGTHTLYLYGNQSNGTILNDQVSFTVQKVTTGGGGGGVIIDKEEKINITLEEQDIHVELKQGESKEVRLLIQNDYSKTTSITLEDQNLNDLLISLSETVFLLNPGESKEIIVTFFATENKEPEMYLEKIIIKTDNSQKDIYFYVEVESKDLLFDVRVNIPQEPRIYAPGENLLVDIELFNLGQGEADLNVEYLIKDLEGNVIFGEKQTLIIGTSINLAKVFKLPDNIEEGDYIFYVKADYQGKTAIASKGFKILKPTTLEQDIEDTFNRITEAGGDLIENIKDDWNLLGIAALIFAGSFIMLGLIERLLKTDNIYWVVKEKGRSYLGAGKRRKRNIAIKHGRKHHVASKRSKKGKVKSKKKKKSGHGKGLLQLVLENKK